jgi:septal ring factor EnvC (AmiA/AmiB activator)
MITPVFSPRISRTAAYAVFVCLTLLLVSNGVYSQSDDSLNNRIGNQQKELDRIKKEIDQHRAESKKLGTQEQATRSKLSSLEKEIDLSRQFLKNLKQQESLIGERVNGLRTQILLEDSTMLQQCATLARRIRQLYKRDPNHQWDVVLGSANMQQAFRRYKFSQIIAEQDAALIAEIRDRKMSYETESAELTESLAEIAVVRQSREEEARKLEASKKKRQIMLAQIKNEKGDHAEAIEELEATQKKVKDLIGNLEKHRLEQERQGIVPEGDFAKLKGKLIKPVDGKIVRGFGTIKHPKYGTVTFNNGVDFGAAAGDPIRAVAPGLVEFVDWIEGYGKCVILNHGGGYYTLYAHVANTFVSQDQTVAYGAVIAEVGDSGGLDGFECHFEIRKSKQALDPTQWFAR